MLVSVDIDVNDNEYDDEDFVNAANKATAAIEALFAAGAGGAEIADVVENALQNAGAT